MDEDIQYSQNNTREKVNYKLYFFSIITFGIALFSKEVSVSFLIGIMVISVLHNLYVKNPVSFLKNMVIKLVPYIMVFVFYFMIRFFIVEVQPSFGTDRYQFHIGFNIIKNIILFVISAFIPISSATVFVAFKKSELFKLSLSICAIVVFSIVVVYGLLKSHRQRLLFLISFLAFICSFPVILLNHISELYVYNSMPFISILVGTGLGKLCEITNSQRIKQVFLFILYGAFFFSNIFAVQNKIALMNCNGMRASKLLEQIIPYTVNIPPDGELVLLNPQSEEVEYSVFLINGFSVLKYGLHRIKQLSERDDFEVKIIEESDFDTDSITVNRLVLTLSNEKVSVFTEHGK